MAIQTRKTQARTTMADIGPTPEDAGVTLTVTVTAYDSGLIMVDDRVVNRDKDEAQGYISVMALVAEKLEMLRRESARRAS